MTELPPLPDDERLGRSLVGLGAVVPTGLASTRDALHWAAQAVASIGFTFVSPAEDFSHTALRWDRETRALSSQAASGGFWASLRLADASVALLDAQRRQVAETTVAGRTLDQLYAFVANAAAQQTGDRVELVRPTHELPAHAVQSGAEFPSLPPAELVELARWFQVGDAVVGAVSQMKAAGPMRVWPHHFDVATLLELGEGRSIGVGLSPGDGSYGEPYFYVTPWPYPAGDLPGLEGGGTWHTDGWTGAVLSGSVLVGTPAIERAAALDAFVRSALDAGTRLLDTP